MNSLAHHWFMVSFSGNDANKGGVPLDFVLNFPFQKKMENINAKALEGFKVEAVKWFSESHPQVQLENVLLKSISYLGHMTPDEFYAE